MTELLGIDLHLIRFICCDNFLSHKIPSAQNINDFVTFLTQQGLPHLEKMSEPKAARPGQSASDDLASLVFDPLIDPSDVKLERLRELGIDPSTTRVTVGRFVHALKTNNPDQPQFIHGALAFSQDGQSRLCLLVKAKKLLPDQEEEHNPPGSPQTKDIDLEGWVESLNLPLLSVHGRRCIKLVFYRPFEASCKSFSPYEESCPSSVLEDNLEFILRLSSEDIQSVEGIVGVDHELIMPSPSEFRARFGKEAEEMSLFMVCICTQALFRNRKTLRDDVWEKTMKSCKTLLRRTVNDEKVRMLIGTNQDNWKEIHDVFTLAIPVLEAQSLAPIDPQTGTSGSFSALMASNHDTLMTDLERLNDILLVARNCLATVTKAQNLAAESLLDQQVQKLVDLCVRVTARGYDGDAGSRTEIQWGDVIGACKSTDYSLLYILVASD